MKVDGKHMTSIWLEADGRTVGVIDQTRLPHRLETLKLTTVEDAALAISTMVVRGAPLIGATAAYGMALAAAADASDQALEGAARRLIGTRPTAVNLRWAVERMRLVVEAVPMRDRADRAFAEAQAIAAEDVAINRALGASGLALIEQLARRAPDRTTNILTHCNAGWLAAVDVGTATAPIYAAHDAGIPLHVWVDETRPRNQGASLTAWELGRHGVPHTIIVDNAGGYLMQHGKVDLCIVGTDRTTARGDVANKIGTYLKALAARDNDVPFYVALPSPTIDWELEDGSRIRIEERDASEVSRISGLLDDGGIGTVTIVPEGSRCANPAFDVTPARLITGLITERGIAKADRASLLALFPDRTGTRAA